MDIFSERLEKSGDGRRPDEPHYRLAGLINSDTPVLVVPNDITEKGWQSIMSLPWSKQAKASEDGTFTFAVSFVPRADFKSFANLAIQPKAKEKTRNAGKQKS